jgi:hypothetical protein
LQCPKIANFQHFFLIVIAQKREKIFNIHLVKIPSKLNCLQKMGKSLLDMHKDSIFFVGGTYVVHYPQQDILWVNIIYFLILLISFSFCAQKETKRLGAQCPETPAQGRAPKDPLSLLIWFAFIPIRKKSRMELFYRRRDSKLFCRHG